ncbi:MAG: hypothetical protein V1810_03460 [Candidatus Beckwithbacteria bacterium]
MGKITDLKVKSDEILVNPCTAISLLERSAREAGLDTINTERFYERTREAWIASVFLLALRKIEGNPWWFKVNSEKHLAPDVFAYKFLEFEPRKTRRLEKFIEVFRWVKNTKTTLIGEIEKKLNKHYPSSFTLVCYVMRKGKIKLAKINSKLRKIRPNSSEIWILGTSKQNPRDVLVGRVWPELLTTKINIDDECAILTEPKFLVPYRGYKKDLMYEKLGKTALLKPNFDVEDLS